MKTFFNLVQEIQNPGFCCRCGGCSGFCTAAGYRALKTDNNGKPVYSDVGKCVECGLCYSICPETRELDEEIKQRFDWSEPMGRVIEATVARAADPSLRERAADGGALSALLIHLLEHRQIDGAIVAGPAGRFQRRPFLAKTAEDIRGSAGFLHESGLDGKHTGEPRGHFSTVEKISEMMQNGLRRVALVGTPCQIKSVRKMQELSLSPSDAIAHSFGLFCSGSFIFGPKEKNMLAGLADTSWDDVKQINLKRELILTLKSGAVKNIPLEKLDFMKLPACNCCPDYSGEFADISFGGLGAEDGWTTVITRTPTGRDLLAGGHRTGCIEQFNVRERPDFASQALHSVHRACGRKKKAARYKRRDLKARPVRIRV